ncbi:MAG: GTP cyclohydrolase II, partial [Paracoccaceae bacterium]
MTFAPDITERLARARADLRMGVGVVLEDAQGGGVMLAAETLDDARLADLRTLGQATLAITGWRAATLKARAYDGDVARVVLPADVTRAWIKSVADPADDLRAPMKGPLRTLRDGPADLHRAAIALAKAARLLPAAIVVPMNNAAAFARAHDLTSVSVSAVRSTSLAPLAEVISARVPMQASDAGRVHVFRPDDGGE